MIHAALILALLGSPFYDDGTSAVVTFPLVCTGDVDLDGNDILDVGTMDFDGTAAKLSSPADGKVTGTNDAGTTGGTLDFTVADMVGVADQAGTGVGDFFVGQTGDLCLDGATCTQYLTGASASQVTLAVDGASEFLSITETGTLTFNDDDSDVTFRLSTSQNAVGAAWKITAKGRNSTPAAYTYAEPLVATIADNTAADEDAEVCIRASNDGTIVDVMCADMDDGVENVTFDFPIVVPTYTQCYDVSGAASPAPGAAPSTGVNTLAAGWAFSDTSTQSIHNGFTIPDCWDGASDITLRLEYMPEDGQAMANGEGIEIDVTYRRAIWGTQTLDNGSPQTVTHTYTSTGGDTATTTYTADITLDYDAVGTVLLPGDRVFGRLDRDHDDPDDDYPHTIILTRAVLCFQQTTPVCDN